MFVSSAPIRRITANITQTLYADSPVDSSLLSLYIHQNYTQFCQEPDECDGVIDWLSWVDSNGGDTWHQGNPHRFHLISLGTLHSLPAPVTRRNQKTYKPQFFDILRKGHEAEDGIRDVYDWLRKDEACLAGGWTRQNIALYSGAVLKARDQNGCGPSRVPRSHRLFSQLRFSERSSSLAEIGNETGVDEDIGFVDEHEGFGTEDRPDLTEAERGGWLEDDAIED